MRTHYVWFGVGLTIATALPARGQVAFDVTDTGVLPGFEYSYLAAYGGGGSQLINESGQVAVTCAASGINPASCDTPPRREAVAARYTPGIGLEPVSSLGPDAPSASYLIGEGGDVYGITTYNDWVIAAVEADQCLWQPVVYDTEIWGFSAAAGRGVVLPPLAVNDPRLIGVSGDRRVAADGTVLVDFINENNRLDTALYSSTMGWHDLRDVIPSGATADTVFASQHTDSGWVAGSIVNAGPPLRVRIFRYSTAGGEQIASMDAFSNYTSVLPSTQAVDESGLVVGQVSFDSDPAPDTADFRTHAIAWLPGAASAIDLHDSTYGTDSVGLAARSGKVLGAYIMAPDRFLTGTFFLWSQTSGMHLIALDPSFDSSRESWAVNAMNSHGVIIGHTQSDEFGDTAWLWSPQHGFQTISAVTDPSTGMTWQILDLLDINDQGQIVADAMDLSSGSADGIRVLILTPVEPCPADLTGDGAVDVFDLLAYLNTWFAGASTADLNGDAAVDVFDLLTYLESWFSGC